MKLTIGHLYPDLLNLYGDRGNIQCMMKRSQWRGIEAETIEFTLEDTIDFSKLDIVLLGGGSDREQMIVCSQLRNIQKDFKSYVEDGGSVLAVCGGYQLLGHYYKTEEGTIEGLSLVDLYTEQGSPRLIDNIVLENKDFSLPIVGFENHGGRTYIGDNPFPPCDTTHDTVISLPEKLTHIGSSAFSGWPVRVMKLNSIRYIGSGAFYGCPVDSVILPSSFDMEDIDPFDIYFTSPFGGCSLKYVEICCPHSADNTSYLFDRESLSTDTIYIPPYESEDYWRQWNWGGDLEFIEKGGIFLTAHLSEDVSLVSAIVEAGYRPEDDIHTLNLYGILSPEDISLITGNMPRLRLLNLSGVHNSVLDGFSTGDLSCVEVRLPYLSEIPDSAFCNSASLDALAFPNMSGRSSTFDIPCCVTSIGRRAFAGLSRIGWERIIIPSSVSELGDSAFASIPSLRYIEFGSGIDTIRSPFTSASVDTIVLHSSVPPVVLGDLPVDKNSCVLQVPIDGYDYFSDPFWKNFRNIQRIDMSSDKAVFSVSVSASGKGTVSYNGIPCGSAAVKVTCGLFSILPDDGWIIDRVLFNGIDCTSSVSGAGDLYLPAQDGHLDVSFAEATHTVEFFISK